MSLSIERFDEFFHVINGYAPFPWQSRLARLVFEKGWPDCIDLPTASGKTAAIDIAVFVLACQAGVETNVRKVGRRIYFTVNRRVIVDEAFDRSFKLAKKLLEAKDGILKEVADALRSISGDKEAPPLDVVPLRGGIYRDRAWARSITQPIIVCTTADQLGSRLLFRGYGVSSSMQPIHAALTACDSLILLDEAHVTKAFSQTLGLLNRYRQLDKTSPPMRFVQMTATPTGPVTDTFTLDDDDQTHPILNARQGALKPAELVKVKAKSIVGEIVDRAIKSLSPERKAIGIIVNRVQTARDVASDIREELDKKKIEGELHLVIGRMRPIDRDDLQAQLRTVVGPDRPEVLPKPYFIVATQCLEVGADYDFDALITECASIDAIRQRFGRLNRKGRQVEVRAAIVTNDASLKVADPIYGDAMKLTWEWLKKGDRKVVDFGIIEFKKLWDEVEESTRLEMLAPAPDAAVLLPAHLDAFCQTAPYPEPSPDVSFFIHGPQRDNAEVSVCWRADFGNDENFWPEIVELLPPTSPECMTVPLQTVANWMRSQPTRVDADVAMQLDPDESREAGKRSALIWRGSKDASVTQNPRDLRPGDTVVISAAFEDSFTLGHIPVGRDGILKLDIAERAYAEVRRQRIIRVHPSIHPELPKALRDYAVSEEAVLSKPQIRELLGLAEMFKSGPDEIDYPRAPGKATSGLLLRFNKLLPNDKALHPACDEDDGEDSSVESTQQVALSAHTQHVVDRVKQAIDRLHLNGLSLLFDRSAYLHDIGKADIRFQAVLAGLTPYEAMDRPTLLAKSGQRGLARVERDRQRDRAKLPSGFRHEMLSVELLANAAVPVDTSIDGDLLLHLIGSHHGHARPFAPVVIDDSDDETRSIAVNGFAIPCDQRRAWVPSHRLNSGVAERFWKLTRDHGWWGLAWLESILRLADQQASAAEQETQNGVMR